jgi:hypothetical protein
MSRCVERVPDTIHSDKSSPPFYFSQGLSMSRINSLFVVTITTVVLLVCNGGLFADDDKTAADVPITITVYDSDKRPATKVEIRSNITTARSSRGETVQIDNGKHTLKARVGDLLHIEAYDSNGNCSRPMLVEITENKPRFDVNLTLEPATKVLLNIKNVRTGKPLSRESLSIQHLYTTPDGQTKQTESRWGQTNEDGIATFCLHSGNYMLMIHQSGHGFYSLTRDFTIKKDSTEVSIEEQLLRPSNRPLRVQVNDADGKPVENVEVLINGQRSKTDRNGQFSWQQMHSIANLISAVDTNEDGKTIRRKAMKFVSGDVENVTITLQPAVTVKGKLIDIDTDEPAQNMTVKLQLCNGFSMGTPRTTGEKISVQTKEDGSFEIENLPVGAFYLFTYHGKDRENNNDGFYNNTANLFIPNKNVTLQDIKVQCLPAGNNYNEESYIRLPEAEEQFIQRFSAVIESASIRERKTLLYFDERYKFDERFANQYRVTKPFMFSLNPFINNILVRDVASRYELVGGEVEFVNPSDDVVFITKQLDIDLTKEVTGLLCILDAQGNLVAKRKFSELTREDDAGLIDVEKLKKFLEDEK